MGSLFKMLRPVAALAVCVLAVASGKLHFGPIAEYNHNNKAVGCDPDYGWLEGVEGTGKCYMLIKSYDYSTCYTSGEFGGYGMSWFNAMECCYYNGGYLAEPQNAEEQAKMENYIVASTGPDKQNTWWLGGTDMHAEGGWRWMSGNPWVFENWNEGEPNNKGGEDCLALDGQASYRWMDLGCDTLDTIGTMQHYTICEKRIE